MLERSSSSKKDDLQVLGIEGFRTKLIRSSSENVYFLINIRNEDDVKSWLQKFYELTASKYNVKKSVKSPSNRAQYYLSLVCHHGSRNRGRNNTLKTKTG